MSSHVVSDSFVMARRNLEHVRRVPEKLLDVTLQPIMFTLLFTYVFGAVIEIPGGTYREYLIPGILVQTLAFGMMGPGMTMVSDLSGGVVDRLRVLPMARPAFLVGFLIAEVAASLLAVTILIATGLVVGWRIHTDFAHAASGVGLLLLMALTFVSIGAFLGMVARTADSVQGIAFMVVFPMTFLASTFVPIEGLTPVLRTIAEWNPITAMAAAIRTLFGNPVAPPSDPALPLQHPVATALIWCIGLLIILVPLGIKRYEARTRG